MSDKICPVCKNAVKESVLALCSKCGTKYHLECLKVSVELQRAVGNQKDWLCNECKVCTVCKSPHRQDNMVLCDGCDKGFHTFCLKPALQKSPQSQMDWFCSTCEKDRQNSSIGARRRSLISPMKTAQNSVNSSPIRPKRLSYASENNSLTNEHNSRKRKASETSSSDVQNSPKRRMRNKSGGGISASRSEINEKLREEALSHAELKLDEITTSQDLDMFRRAKEMCARKVEHVSGILPKNEQKTGFPVVIMGRYSMVAANVAPYPPQFNGVGHLFLCEFCLKPHSSPTLLKRHAAKCVWKHPPGNEIYRNGTNSVWEVDGKVMRAYCQNLCLLSKMFLDHKTLYFDVDPFLFYILTEADDTGCHTVGYFSKEKESMMNYNLSCLLTLPPYQRKGYGHMLIQFSYLLSVVEKRIGSPEHPLSDLGLLTYRNYWKDTILLYLLNIQQQNIRGECMCIKDMSLETGIHANDLMSTLQWMGMVKNWKGQYFVYTRPEIIKEAKMKAKKLSNRHKMTVKKLLWTSFHERLNNSNSSNLTTSP